MELANRKKDLDGCLKIIIAIESDLESHNIVIDKEDDELITDQNALNNLNEEIKKADEDFSGLTDINKKLKDELNEIVTSIESTNEEIKVYTKQKSDYACTSENYKGQIELLQSNVKA